MKATLKKHITGLALLCLGLLLSLWELSAQSPTHIDTRRKDPKPFTLDDILLYIVFPVILFLAAYLLRRYQNRQTEKTNTPEE